MKQTIRLTEGDLHRIIRECINEAQKVLTYDGWLPSDYASDCGYKFLPTSKSVPTSAERPWLRYNLHDKASQMSSDWDCIRHTYPYGTRRCGVPVDRIEAMADEKIQNGLFKPDWSSEELEDCTNFDWEGHDLDAKADRSAARSAARRVDKMADKRPLHRKGSLNRALD